MTIFGVRLQDTMDKRGVSAAQLSRKTNIHESNLSRYLAGTSEPSLKNLLLLAQALDVSADWLSGKEEMETQYEIQFGERELMRIYSALSLAGKDKVLEYAELLLAKENKNV